MLLTLTIMNREGSWQEDIQVNPQQKLIDTMLILKEAGKLPQEEVQEMKSERRGRFLDMNKNYEQQSIYDGDILCIQ
ncbi:MAG: hypothetical protein MR594_02950 [Lachnospiraceae bacterium]|nr:hypothetical protein [Lachnospiraceae bacterium]